MRRPAPTLWLAAFALAFCTCIGLLLLDRFGGINGLGHKGTFQLSDRLAQLETRTVGDETHVFVHGREYTAEAFIAELHRRNADRHPNAAFFGFLNITSWTGIAWVTLGLLAQLLFTARMLIQWLASERAQESVVPEAFWWLSLIGATMLLMYFTWRVDVVGILGQSTGWGIYVRNLWLIHYPRPAANPADHPSVTTR